MKKKKLVGLTASLALGTALILTMTACGSSTNDLIGKEYAPTAPSMSSVSLTALDDYTIDGMDDFGIITAHKDVTPEATDTEQYPDTETNCLLYDATANKQIASTTKTEGYISSASSVYVKMTDGLYCYTETSETTGEPTYIYYGKSGVVKTSNELITPPVNSSDRSVTFADGTVLVVAEDGTVNTYTPGIKPVFMPEVFEEYKDVYVQSLGGTSYRVWNAKGEIVREVDLDKEMNKPAIALDVENWTVGNSRFEQYMVALPDDAADYDFIYGDFSSGTSASRFKVDLVTKSYNFENGKVKEYNVDFVVSSVNPNPASEDGVFLSVQTISDKQISASRTYQYYGEDLKVRVDLQKLLPDCNKVEIDGDYVVLSSPAAINVYQDGKLVGSADAAADVTFQDGYFVQTVGSNKYIYTLDGSHIFEGVTSSASLGEKLYHNIFNGIIYYTVKEEVTTTSASGTTTQGVEIVYAYANGSETRLGEGTYSNRWITIENTVDDETTSTVYYAGYTDAVVSNLSGLSDVEASATNGETSYFLYRYNETVESGSGDSVTTETVTKYVLVTVTEPAK